MAMKARKRIAIVSADIILQSQLKSYLSDIGHSIKVVQNYGDELDSLVESFSPDLLIVDPEAPDLTGVEIGLHLRQISSTPILMLSSFGTPKNQLRLLDTRSRDFLGRPFGFPDLAARIDQILSIDGSEKDEIDIFGS
jgi:two-component system KDP operon response regulator KdpE